MSKLGKILSLAVVGAAAGAAVYYAQKSKEEKGRDFASDFEDLFEEEVDLWEEVPETEEKDSAPKQYIKIAAEAAGEMKEIAKDTAQKVKEIAKDTAEKVKEVQFEEDPYMEEIDKEFAQAEEMLNKETDSPSEKENKTDTLP